MSSQATTKRSKRKRRATVPRWCAPIIKLVLCPVILFWDSFRKRRLTDRSWLYAFFLLTTVIMAVAFGTLLFADDPADQVLKMLTAVKSQPILLDGDINPVIYTINEYGLKNNVDPNLIFALIQKESNFNARAVSPTGRRGLMQLTPFVWRQYSGSTCPGTHHNRIICSNRNCIFDPQANIRVGVKYLRTLIDYYHGRIDLALAAYDAGLTNVVPGQMPQNSETRKYVKKIFLDWHDLRKKAIAYKLELALKFRRGIKQLLAAAFICWLLLFWWANRKLF
ncbi:MAG: lytic transglycosylase domain-containing protein [Bacillota bacterium]|jgi:hypothetical protein